MNAVIIGANRFAVKKNWPQSKITIRKKCLAEPSGRQKKNWMQKDPMTRAIKPSFFTRRSFISFLTPDRYCSIVFVPHDHRKASHQEAFLFIQAQVSKVVVLGFFVLHLKTPAITTQKAPPARVNSSKKQLSRVASRSFLIFIKLRHYDAWWR